jgi:hypothetical protein
MEYEKIGKSGVKLPPIPAKKFCCKYFVVYYIKNSSVVFTEKFHALSFFAPRPFNDRLCESGVDRFLSP